MIKSYFTKKYEECLDKSADLMRAEFIQGNIDADLFEVFDQIADCKSIVGYYLANYGIDAYRKWKHNTKFIHLDSRDKKVKRVLWVLDKADLFLVVTIGIVLAVLLHRGIALMLMDVVDIIGEIFDLNVVSIIDRLNDIYYL